MTDINTCSDPVAGGTWTTANTPIGRTIGKVPFFMVDLLTADPSYYVNTDRWIMYQSNSYMPFPFAVEQVKNVVGPSPISLKIATSNIDRSVAAIVLGEAVQGREIIVRKAYWTEANPSVTTSPYIYFQGLIDTVVIKEEESTASVEFEIKNDFVRWDTPLPKNSYNPGCQWVFKSTTPGCQYTGTASLCDRSYDRCIALQNTARFRGFRHMTKLEDLQIWWGKNRESSD